MRVRRKSTVEGLLAMLARPGISVPATPLSFAVGAWTTPAFLNSWANYGGEFRVAQYQKTPDGQVYLRGLVKKTAGANGTAIFTLPPGFRPTAPETFAVTQFNEGETLRVVGWVQVKKNGEVVYEGGQSKVPFLYLNQVFFDTAA